jgi:hypothetical protein
MRMDYSARVQSLTGQELRLDWKRRNVEKWKRGGKCRWLTLKAALDAVFLVLRAQSLGWHETLALVALHAQAANHRAAVFPRINDDAINHWKVTSTWEQDQRNQKVVEEKTEITRGGLITQLKLQVNLFFFSLLAEKILTESPEISLIKKLFPFIDMNERKS